MGRFEVRRGEWGRGEGGGGAMRWSFDLTSALTRKPASSVRLSHAVVLCVEIETHCTLRNVPGSAIRCPSLTSCQCGCNDR